MQKRQAIAVIAAGALSSAALPSLSSSASRKAPLLAEKKEDMSRTSEMQQICERLINQEIPAAVQCSAEMQALILTVSLTALNAGEALSAHFEKALDAGVAPVKLREAVVQTMAYSGLAYALEAESRLAAALAKKGLSVELPESGVATDADRFEKGIAVQKSIFGPAIDQMHQNAKPDEKFLTVTQLSGWCFGDAYTRKDLTLQTRELLTFCAIAAMGGCDPQARAHALGNVAVGNGRKALLDALAVMLPVIGFPKTLNALAAVDAAVPAEQQGGSASHRP